MMRTHLYRERFMSRIEKTAGCWMWRGHVGPRGYGTACHFGERRAHRIMYHFAYGDIPDGLQVLHTCDTPACVRPDHLFVGTIKDNTLDAFNKGRRTRSITEAQAKQIRELLLDRNCTQVEIGRIVGCPAKLVSRIACGRTWQHLGPATPAYRHKGGGIRGRPRKGTAEKVSA